MIRIKSPGQRLYEATPTDTLARLTWDELSADTQLVFERMAAEHLHVARRTGQRPTWAIDEDFSGGRT